MACYLDLVISDQSFEFFLQPSNTRFEGISHCVQINRNEWMCVLDDCFMTNLGVECPDMIMQVNIQQQIRFEILKIFQA